MECSNFKKFETGIKRSYAGGACGSWTEDTVNKKTCKELEDKKNTVLSYSIMLDHDSSHI